MGVSGKPYASPHKNDLRVIACIIVEETKQTPAAARAYLLQCRPDRQEVLVQSNDGRWVRIWMPVRKLDRFQVVSVSGTDAFLHAKLVQLKAEYWTEESYGGVERLVANLQASSDYQRAVFATRSFQSSGAHTVIQESA